MNDLSRRVITTAKIIIITALLSVSLCACSKEKEELAIPEVTFEEVVEESNENGYEVSEETDQSEEPENGGKTGDTGFVENRDDNSATVRSDEADATLTPGGNSQGDTALSEYAADGDLTADAGAEDAGAVKIMNVDAEVPDVVIVKEEKPEQQPVPETPQETQQEAPQEKPQETPQEVPQEAQGPSADDRILFIGDSRTIDMFADSDDTISGAVVDGITVYAAHGRGFDYMTGVINDRGIDSFDTLITWMGANDAGDFSRYAGYYESILAAGKRLVLCTVGPTNDSTLAEWDHPDYENDKMVSYNGSLIQWAQQHGVYVIDLYSFIAANVQIDDADGIHYLPRPTGSIWAHILSHKNGHF